MSRKISTDSAIKNATNSFVTLHKKYKEILKGAFKQNDAGILKAQFDLFKNNVDSDKKPALDQAFREFLLMTVLKDVEKVGVLIGLSIEAVRLDIVSVTIPVVLLGDAFEAVTLEKCETIFTFVEKHVSVWKEECFFINCKNNILRMCNDLLRRMSRTQNTVFCGRILLFLAKFFPFSERSGLNVISEFNLDNVTEYGIDGKDPDEMLADTLEDIPVKIDYNLYCKFWALQDFFRNPNQCYNKVQWKTFASHAATVLSAFGSFKLEEPRSQNSTRKKKHDEISMETDEEKIVKSENFFAKFLTNPKLLALQLSDSNFRRSVLVQFLILFQYLTSTVKFKTESLTLNPSQSEFIKETEQKIYELLDETPPQGKNFSKTVQHMLEREEIWNNWKNDGCKDFTKVVEETVIANNEDEVAEPEVKIAKKSSPKKPLGDSLKEAIRKGQFYLGTNEMTRLWNLSPDNLSACKSEDRNFLPSLELYLENPRERTDPSFEWRALRLLARQSPHFFTLFNTPSYKISDYLDTVRKKIQKDKIDVLIRKEESSSSISNMIENNESESVAIEDQEEQEIAAVLIKNDQLIPEDQNVHKTIIVTPEQLNEIAASLGADWKKLGKKLAFSADELLFFETENLTVPAQAKAMLKIWFDDDVDASLENLAYILEGLELNAAAEYVKLICEQCATKLDDNSD